MVRAPLVLALAVVAPGSAFAAGTVGAPAPGCVSALKDVRSGSGDRTYASHYVTAGAYGYGEFLAGSFGGQSLWRQRGSLWCRIETGATVLDRRGIVAAGVPANVADRLIAEMRSGGELAPPKPAPTRMPLRLPSPSARHR